MVKDVKVKQFYNSAQDYLIFFVRVGMPGRLSTYDSLGITRDKRKIYNNNQNMLLLEIVYIKSFFLCY